MTHLIRLTNNLGTLAAIFAQVAMAQSTGSISGRVLSEQGLSLLATVTLSFAGPRGYPAPPRRVFTGTNGAFTFSRLAAGTYALCAQIAASEAAPANSPYVDTCVWGSGQAPIALLAGQQLAGIVFTAPKGAWLSGPCRRSGPRAAAGGGQWPRAAGAAASARPQRPRQTLPACTVRLHRRYRAELPDRGSAEDRHQPGRHQHGRERVRPKRQPGRAYRRNRIPARHAGGPEPTDLHLAPELIQRGARVRLARHGESQRSGTEPMSPSEQVEKDEAGSLCRWTAVRAPPASPHRRSVVLHFLGEAEA